MTTCDVPELKLVTSKDVKAVKNFVREFFDEYEPLNAYLIKKECEDFRYFERASNIGDLIDEGMSYMFVTKTKAKTKQIVAVVLVGNTGSIPKCEHPTPIYLKLMPFFEMLEEEVKQIVNVTETDKEASFWIIAVHPDWRGRCLAKCLLIKVKASLKIRGFTHIRSFCTSAYSTNLFEKLGFKKLYSFKYTDYAPNGEVVILPDEPHTHVNFMRIKLL